MWVHMLRSIPRFRECDYERARESFGLSRRIINYEGHMGERVSHCCASISGAQKVGDITFIECC